MVPGETATSPVPVSIDIKYVTQSMYHAEVSSKSIIRLEDFKSVI